MKSNKNLSFSFRLVLFALLITPSDIFTRLQRKKIDSLFFIEWIDFAFDLNFVAMTKTKTEQTFEMVVFRFRWCSYTR